MPIQISIIADSLGGTPAIELIEGKGGSAYLKGMKRIFRDTPGLIEDVAPKYRERLREILEGNK